jgi:hypothetical protein
VIREGQRLDAGTGKVHFGDALACAQRPCLRLPVDVVCLFSAFLSLI